MGHGVLVRRVEDPAVAEAVEAGPIVAAVVLEAARPAPERLDPPHRPEAAGADPLLEQGDVLAVQVLVADGDLRPRLLFGADHGVGVLDRAGGRLLHQDVAAGLEACHRHRPVQVDAGRDGDEVDLPPLLRQHLPEAVVHRDAALAQGGDVGGEGPVVEGRGDLRHLPDGSLRVELARPGAVVGGEPPHADDGYSRDRHGFISCRKPGVANRKPRGREVRQQIRM